MSTEIEAKFININKEELRTKLKSIDAILKTPERLMRRKTFDFKDLELPAGEFKWMRVRDEGDKITVTLKHQLASKQIDNLHEYEVSVDSFEKACELLIEMNMIETNYQENYRELWIYKGAEVTIDTWPTLEPIVEIEAENEELVKVIANDLGFDYSKAFFGSNDFIFEHVHNIKSSALKEIPVLTFGNVEEVMRRYEGLRNTN